ncbi:MAG: radical SAM protein [Elusimicrobia bacterium]|nr:radical SAM protein [Elusimicrobiota bacterium]
MGKSQAEARGQDAVVFPPDVARKLGLEPGARLDLIVERGHIKVRPNIHSLAKVYIEPSSRCNLSCRTCIRQTWSEPQGDMAPAVFRKIVADLRRFPHLGSVMLGGFGEPTLHPDILSMIVSLKTLKAEVEMVSNGTLLDDRMLEGLLKGGLDRLWISFDGTEGPNHEHIRQGAHFDDVVASLKRLRDMHRESDRKTALGIAFVVTRRNLLDLKDIGELARRVGADLISVSNVIPYNPDMELQMVCNQAITLGTFASTPGKMRYDLPRIDANESTKEALWQLLAGHDDVSLMGDRIGTRVDECRFIRERCACIRWDGKVAPCMGLMHSHETYFQRRKKTVRSYSPGDITLSSLRDIWDAEDYASFRQKVADFDFSPCHVCGGCDLVDENQRDCAGNDFPATCGGCLWAQGIIQCP